MATSELTELDPAEIALRRKKLRVVETSKPVWTPTVLLMGARERNGVIKQLQLSKEEIADLKTAARRFKQTTAQQRYRKRPAGSKAAAASLP